jgi:hypothetical protein
MARSKSLWASKSNPGSGKRCIYEPATAFLPGAGPESSRNIARRCANRPRDPAARSESMDGDAANPERHADLAKRTADLEALHASLDFIDSELLVKDVLSKLDRTEFLREQMVAAREARKST